MNSFVVKLMILFASDNCCMNLWKENHETLTKCDQKHNNTVTNFYSQAWLAFMMPVVAEF